MAVLSTRAGYELPTDQVEVEKSTIASLVNESFSLYCVSMSASKSPLGS
jgi:hypothetical protein